MKSLRSDGCLSALPTPSSVRATTPPPGLPRWFNGFCTTPLSQLDFPVATVARPWDSNRLSRQPRALASEDATRILSHDAEDCKCNTPHSFPNLIAPGLRQDGSGFSLSGGPLWSSGRFYLRPELLMVEHFPFANLFSRCFQNGLQPGRIGHEQPLNFVRILDAHDHCSSIFPRIRLSYFASIDARCFVTPRA